jgi:adenosylcobyric acid synthase
MSALMVQGASSWAGKSLLTTALARLIARRGISVAPFKAQNMSNNARVVDGGEIGVAQYLQAVAARVRPDVRMNPVLIKPEAEDRSQVVILGRADLDLSRQRWERRPPSLWPVIRDAYESLAAEYDLIIIEGAGSPAEINLRDTDLANMPTARLADARVLLVADIDRGGAFAHLYGTWALLDPPDRARLCGFVLNKFRGDPKLLRDGPAQLEEKTGVPVLAVVPLVDHGVPDEDGAALARSEPDRPVVAVVRAPASSNLDEFKALEQVVNVVWAGAPEDLENADLVVLPGSKHVASDLAWMRARGLESAVAAAPRVLGICGGLQILGGRVDDPDGVEGAAEGFGLIGVRTTLDRDKTTRRTRTRFGTLPEPWAALSGIEVDGYEIRHGHTEATGAAAALPGGLGFVEGSRLGVYVHGLFEQPAFARALLAAAPTRTLDEEIDRLADAVGEHLDVDRLLDLAAIL